MENGNFCSILETMMDLEGQGFSGSPLDRVRTSEPEPGLRSLWSRTAASLSRCPGRTPSPTSERTTAC